MDLSLLYTQNCLSKQGKVKNLNFTIDLIKLNDINHSLALASNNIIGLGKIGFGKDQGF